MADYQHILIAVDFSSESSCVIDRGLELAKIYKSQISLIHVVEYAAYLYPPDTPIPFDLDLEQQFIPQLFGNKLVELDLVTGFGLELGDQSLHIGGRMMTAPQGDGLPGKRTEAG